MQLTEGLPAPTEEAKRIESLDVFRGFALLGILLLNIIGFGLLSPSYSNPAYDLTTSGFSSVAAWGTVEVLAEGAMRALFSMLFGAGVVLFTTGVAGKSGRIHYRRTFWLFLIGLFDAYVLLWNGDILVTYALAGAILYLLRNKSAKSLFTMAGILIFLLSAIHAAGQYGLSIGYDAYNQIQESGVTPSSDEIAASGWEEFVADFTLSPGEALNEIEHRTQSYLSVFKWSAEENLGVFIFVVPVILLWDALAMMMIGMALFKSNILQASRPSSFYLKLMSAGFGVGLVVNGYEVMTSYQSNFSIISTFAQLQATYHIGRLGMAIGYIGLFGWICKQGLFSSFTARLAAVGKMALTNYLMHSLICALIFTGMGFGLLGQFERAELYPIVFGIWVLQLWLSPWWLNHFRFGPVEWLWRVLTYGTLQVFKRDS